MDPIWWSLDSCAFGTCVLVAVVEVAVVGASAVTFMDKTLNTMANERGPDQCNKE